MVFLILKQSHSATTLPRKIPSNHRFWGGFWNVETTTKLTKTGFGRWAEGFRAFRASLPSDGSSCWPDGDHSNPANQLLRKYRQREESAASAGHGSLAICLLELLAAGIHWFEIYRRQRWLNMLHCSVMIFMTFSLCFMRGVPKIPLQVLPNFPHDIHDHCAGRLDGTCWALFSWYFFLVIALDYFACFQKNMTWIHPPASNSGKKRSRLRFLAKCKG